MPADIKAQFIAFYRSDVEALQDRIGRDLGNWLRQ